MNCKKCTELVSQFVDDCIAETMREEFVAHIAVCANCAENVRATEALVKSLRDLSCKEAPFDCWACVRERLTPQARPARRPFRVLRSVLAIPALIVLVLLAVLALWPNRLYDTTPPVQVSAPEYSRYISVHSSFQRQQTLTDPHLVFVTAELEQASVSHGKVGK